ncbi:MAG: DUF1810 domain-containing protein [Hyphomicrobiaceae bacterium]
MSTSHDTSASAPDPFNLQRFITAQEGVFERACTELEAGRKDSHWMWFIFPQMKGLGHSLISQQFSIGSLAEAKAYLADPVLGPRLAKTTALAISHADLPLRVLFGEPDDLKFRSSMTLFAAAAGKDSMYATAIEEMCGGEPDHITLHLIDQQR